MVAHASNPSYSVDRDPEAEIRRIMIQGQPTQKVYKTPS
jgi:hypothetical protein